MNREQILKDVIEIFEEVFDTEEQITELTMPDDIAEWDSLENINLILQLEKHFNIRFDMNELGELDQVKKIVDCIESRMNM